MAQNCHHGLLNDKKLTFFTRRKMTVNRPIVVTPDTSDDVSAQQGKPSIALHCDRGIVGYWKLGGGS